MDTKKRVSVVMATYNGAKYIREQLDSIIAQTYPVYEIIIQDDGSTDGTKEICREYEAKYPYIHVYFNDRNMGLNENFKTAVMRTKGEFVAISDQDDIWFPEKIERQVAAIGSHTMCYSQHLRGSDPDKSRLVDYKNSPERHLFKGVVGHSMLLEGAFARDEATWPGGLAYDIWLTALPHFRNGVVRIPEPLNWHRTHDGQASEDRNKKKPSVWEPYVYGVGKYRKLQKSEGWKLFNERIKEESKGKNLLTYKLASLMLQQNPLSLLKLCFLCYSHRATVYPSDQIRGVMGHVRSFCFPLIHAYYGDGFYKMWR